MYGILHIDINCAYRSLYADGRSVSMMKKIYTAPILECWAFCSATTFANETPDDPDPNNSNLWNDGELGWT